MPNKRSKPPTRRYDVGYRRPPSQFRFKKGQIGNPKGINKKVSIAPDLRAILERALNEQLKPRAGERDQARSYRCGFTDCREQCADAGAGAGQVDSVSPCDF